MRNDCCQVIESGPLSSKAIMAKDTFLLSQLNEKSPPILHLYEWEKDCLTYGYFTDPAHHLNLDVLNTYGIQKARRPTGGGIIFHLTDLAFSILIPAHHPRFSLNTLDNYAFINQKVAESLFSFIPSSQQPHLLTQNQNTSCLDAQCSAFCMAKPTQYDVMIEGKKVGGAAQRRTKKGLLHQASISLLFPPIHLLCQILKNQENVLQAMQKQSYCLLPTQTTAQELLEARIHLQKILKKNFFAF